MKRLQFLTASQDMVLQGNTFRVHKSTALRKIMQERDRQVQTAMDELSREQLIELRQHIYQKLCCERRRCSARAINYDVNNHIRLYLMHKRLMHRTKQNGPD